MEISNQLVFQSKLFCPYHSQQIATHICLDNMCQEKLLCTECIKLGSSVGNGNGLGQRHSPISIEQFYKNMFALSSSSAMNFDQKIMQSCEGVNMREKLGCFQQAASELHGILQKQYSEELAKTYENQVAEVEKSLSSIKKDIFKLFNSYLEDKLSQNSLQNRNYKAKAAKLLMGVIKKQNYVEINNTIIKLHTGKFELAYAKEQVSKFFSGLIQFVQAEMKKAHEQMFAAVAQYINTATLLQEQQGNGDLHQHELEYSPIRSPSKFRIVKNPNQSRSSLINSVVFGDSELSQLDYTKHLLQRDSGGGGGKVMAQQNKMNNLINDICQPKLPSQLITIKNLEFKGEQQPSPSQQFPPTLHQYQSMPAQQQQLSQPLQMPQFNNNVVNNQASNKRCSLQNLENHQLPPKQTLKTSINSPKAKMMGRKLIGFGSDGSSVGNGSNIEGGCVDRDNSKPEFSLANQDIQLNEKQKLFMQNLQTSEAFEKNLSVTQGKGKAILDQPMIQNKSSIVMLHHPLPANQTPKTQQNSFLQQQQQMQYQLEQKYKEAQSKRVSILQKFQKN